MTPRTARKIERFMTGLVSFAVLALLAFAVWGLIVHGPIQP